MKALLLNLLIILLGCTSNQPAVWYTHMINPKQVPIEFEEQSGTRYEITKGNYVELIGFTDDKWELRTLIGDELKTGKIPRISKNGNPILVYLTEFDKKVIKRKRYCYEIQQAPRKVLTLRKRPLTEEELIHMLVDRSSEESKKVNKETALFGLQSGIAFELLDENYGKWQKIRIQTKNLKFVGYISKEVNGIPTKKNNCE